MSWYDTAVMDGALPHGLWSPARVIDPGYGAIDTFLGVVRNRSRGGVADGPYRPVTHLHYQGYRPMAEKVLTQLAEETIQLHGDLRIHLVHALGDLVPGDVSVAIHVASPHRAAAFAACRHLIERLKQDLPVWKRERYADGTEAWLPGS